MKLLRQKTYSKPDSEKSVNLGGKRTKYSEMSEKQLKNLANYEEYKAEKRSTKEGRKDNRKRNLIGATSFAGIGAGVGFYPKYSKILKDDNKVLLDNIKATEATKKVLKATGIGALSGLATWELLKIAADANHKHHAKLAKEELQRRGINDWKTGKTLGERNKEVLEELEKTYSKSASSFKPKFRARFRKGDFSYVQAKDSSDEALNHQAYKEVAAEDEFKNNPETYKIRQGMFSDHPVRQKLYSKTSKIIKGALIAAPVGYITGTIIGSKKGREKASDEEKKAAAKEKINRNNKEIEEYKKAIQDTKKKLGKDWKKLGHIEVDMNLDEINYLKRDIDYLKRQNKELKSGNYNPSLSNDTPTGEKHIRRGQILGTTAGLGTGALAGYGLHKLAKLLKK